MKKLGLLLALSALVALGACGDDDGGPQDNCGNQFGFAINNNYTTLATALADDRLIVDTSIVGMCDQYLAQEANLFANAGINDCGGRSITADVIDRSYSVLVAGDLTDMISDGVDSDDCIGHNDDNFPFMARPQGMNGLPGPGCNGGMM